MVKKKVVKKTVRKKASSNKSATRSRMVQRGTVSLRLKSDDSMRLDARKLGNAVGQVSALFIFIVSVLAMSNRAVGWAMLADVMYGPFGYWPGRFLLGVVWGSILGYAKGFAVGWLIAKVYNKSSGYCSMKK